MKKCKETREYLEEFDVISLTETWIEEERWKKIEKNLLNRYEQKCILARKENRRGRAKGRIIIVISKELEGVRGNKLVNGG